MGLYVHIDRVHLVPCELTTTESIPIEEEERMITGILPLNGTWSNAITTHVLAALSGPSSTYI